LRRPPRSTIFPTRRSSDLRIVEQDHSQTVTRPFGAKQREIAGEGGGSWDIVYHVVVFTLPVIRGHQGAKVVHILANIGGGRRLVDRKSTRLNSSHVKISYA